MFGGMEVFVWLGCGDNWLMFFVLDFLLRRRDARERVAQTAYYKRFRASSYHYAVRKQP
jgi:hypothetical protein